VLISSGVIASSSRIEEAKQCSNRPGLELKFEAIEEMQSVLPSADYKVVCRRPWNHFLTPLPHSGLYWNWLLKGLLWHIGWPMTHKNDFCDMCDTCYKCDTRHVSRHVSHCDTMWQLVIRKIKMQKIQKYDNWEIIYMRHNVTLYNTVTPMWQ
jgi:hypothetical protein